MAGPEGCGKTMLLNAICTELGATLFDLTATNIVGKYPGKSGLNMLLHLVSKVNANQKLIYLSALKHLPKCVCLRLRSPYIEFSLIP